MDFSEKIKNMAEYLDEDSIARALGVDVELVRGVLEGNVVAFQKESIKKTAPVKFLKTAFRQKVISVIRAKGGVGATFLVSNLAHRISEKTSVIVIDLCAVVQDYIVFSDFLDVVGVDNYSINGKVTEIDNNYYYIPYSILEPNHSIDNIIHAARTDFDTIILDLPNYYSDQVKKAVDMCTTALLLYGGGVSEAQRILDLATNVLNKKEAFLITNYKQLSPMERIKKGLGIEQQINLPFDKKAAGSLVTMKSPVYAEINTLVNLIYGGQYGAKEGIFSKIFGR